MARRMDIAVKSKIKTLSDLSWSKRQIAKEVGFSERAVRKFLTNFAKTGNFDRKKGSGRIRKTSQREDICIKRLCSRNRTITSKEIQKELEETTNIKISDRLVRYRLKELGFCSHRPAKKSLLNQEMKENVYCGPKKQKPGVFQNGKKSFFLMSLNLTWWAQMEESGYGENKKSGLRKNASYQL